MQLPIQLLRRMAWRRRLDEVRIWQEAARRESAEYNAAIRRILESDR